MQGTIVVFVDEENLCKIQFYSLANCLFIEHNFCFHAFSHFSASEMHKHPWQCLNAAV